MNVPEEIVGDRQCDETRVYITSLGSIELLGNSYGVDLFRGVDQGTEIEWESGERTILVYQAVAGSSLALSDDLGPRFDCKPRECTA